MELEDTRGGVQYFRIEHSTAYQQVQCEFWDAVDSLNPQNIVVSRGETSETEKI